MSTSSERDRERSLFEEPTEAIERVDAWDGPLGFLVGGMANQSRLQLAEQYFDAASVLTEGILARRWEDYRLVNPILFLYRHALELLLKTVMEDSAKTHHLGELVDALVMYVKNEFHTDIPQWIPSRIREFALIDPNSTAFRYSENRDPATKQYGAVDGEFHVDLLHLQWVMNEIKLALSHLSIAHHP